MFLEILYATVFIVITYLILSVYKYGHSSERRYKYQTGDIRELGLLEWFFHRIFKEDGYFLSNLLIVDSKISMNDVKVEESLLILAKRHPLLQAKIREANLQDGVHYYFSAMSSFMVEYKRSLILANEQSKWADLMSTDLLVPINDQEGPLWRCCRLQECIDPQNTNVTNCFVFTFHHAIIDGISMTRLFDEFLSILEKLHKDEFVEENVYGIRPSFETLLADKIRPEWWRTLLVNILKVPLFKMGLHSIKSRKIDVYFNKYPIVRSVNSNVSTDIKVILSCFSKMETDQLLRACRQHGCKVNGAITAAANIAMAEILKSDHFCKQNSIPSAYAINGRSALNVSSDRNNDYLGFCVFEAVVNCHVPSYDPHSYSEVFWKMANEITRNVHKTISRQPYIEQAKDLQCVTLDVFELGRLSRVCSDHGGRYGDRLFLISNVGRFNQASGALFTIGKIFHSHGFYKEGNLFDIFVTCVNGSLCCSLVYYPHVTTRIQAEEFSCKFIQNLRRAFNENC